MYAVSGVHFFHYVSRSFLTIRSFLIKKMNFNPELVAPLVGSGYIYIKIFLSNLARSHSNLMMPQTTTRKT